jgi:signal transduction histidine kinase
MLQTTLDQDRLKRLIVVGRSLLSELDLDVVLHSVLQTARELTDARYAALAVLDEGRREFAQFLTHGVDDRTHRAIGQQPRGRGTLGLLIDDPRPLRIADVASDPRSYGFPAGHPPMGSFLGVPILIRGEAWGNLYITEKADGEFDQADEDTVVVLADWAAIAIENARLYRTVDARRAQLEAAVRGFEATAAIARAVGGETELDPVLDLIVKRGRALIEARAVLILLRESNDLVVAAGSGQVDLRNRARLPVTDSTSGEVLRAGTARRTTDVVHDLRIRPAALGVPDATAALLVPLVYRGERLGVLVAFDRLSSDEGFSAHDEEVLTAFAASAATAVATAKTVAADRLRRSIEAAEAERRRWARELHDETLQGLGGLKLLLSQASRLDHPDATGSVLRRAIDDVSREIENLRAIITELRPAALDQLGLRPALASLAQRTASVAGLDVATDFALRDDDRRLSPALETTAYRLVQEALTNVVKHACASRVEIVVHEAAEALDVCVADDGTGFDAAAANTGYGLVSMRERVELAGGALHVKSGPTGTAVSAHLPLPTADAA